MLKRKHIEFVAESPTAFGLGFGPRPAAQARPSWYQRMSARTQPDEQTHLVPAGNAWAPNATVRMCVPFSDAMSLGYVAVLESDVEVVPLQDGGINVRWATGRDLVSSHSETQVPGMPAPAAEGSRPDVWKWLSEWRVYTPKGYSILFTHPLNRHDLPFQIMSGVVDTDTYRMAVQFPFQFIGSVTEPFVIERGTPIAQIIPFKRDDWRSTTSQASEHEVKVDSIRYFGKVKRSYRQQYWAKKSYL